MEEQTVQAVVQYAQWIDHPSIVVSSFALLLLTFIALFWFLIKWVKEAIMDKIDVILKVGMAEREKIMVEIRGAVMTELKDNNASHEKIMCAISEISEDMRIMNATYERAYDTQDKQMEKLDGWIRQLLDNLHQNKDDNTNV